MLMVDLPKAELVAADFALSFDHVSPCKEGPVFCVLEQLDIPIHEVYVLLQGSHIEVLAVELHHYAEQSHWVGVTQVARLPHLLLVLTSEVDDVPGS